MNKMIHIILFSLVFILAAVSSCTTGIDDPPEEEKETYFQPGEYGGEPLPDAEHLLWISPSPDGERIALIRRRTPRKLDPFYQLWIMDKDGSNPINITYNVRGVDWHPTENKLTFTYNPHTTPYLYVFTLNLDSGELILWNSKEEHFFDKYTSATGGWFSDGERLLFGVHGKAYQQAYERGTYILNTVDSTHVGPLQEFFQAALVGNNESWLVGVQYTTDHLSSNRALFNLETEEFTWLTTYHTDSDSLRRYTGHAIPNPTGPEIILPKFIDHAWQLFQINSRGEAVRQLTDLGGHQVRWVPENDYFIFNRDTHKAPGARYIPFRYNFLTENEEPLWPGLPDSVPVFPDFSTQDLIHLIDHIQ